MVPGSARSWAVHRQGIIPHENFTTDSSSHAVDCCQAHATDDEPSPLYLSARGCGPPPPEHRARPGDMDVRCQLSTHAAARNLGVRFRREGLELGEGADLLDQWRSHEWRQWTAHRGVGAGRSEYRGD